MNSNDNDDDNSQQRSLSDYCESGTTLNTTDTFNSQKTS